jgi:heme/copper-type cytochrome/quinol oxidase subunit 2
MKTKDIFCANCQLVTLHTAEVDNNGEYVFTCTAENCGRFVKLPAEVATKEDADKLLAEHQTANEGQMSVEAQEKKLDAILTDETVTDTEPE